MLFEFIYLFKCLRLGLHSPAAVSILERPLTQWHMPPKLLHFLAALLRTGRPFLSGHWCLKAVTTSRKSSPPLGHDHLVPAWSLVLLSWLSWAHWPRVWVLLLYPVVVVYSIVLIYLLEYLVALRFQFFCLIANAVIVLNEIVIIS